MVSVRHLLFVSLAVQLLELKFRMVSVAILFFYQDEGTVSVK